MPYPVDLLKRWWKHIVTIVTVSMIAAGVITFLKPDQYIAVTTAVPASPLFADTDDLDIIIGISKRDTIFLAVTDEYNLFDHYKIRKEGNNDPRKKAARELKKNSTIIKSGYGELKIKVWDTDKNLAPQLADALLDKLSTIRSDLQTAGNQATLKELKAGKERLQKRLDSTGINPVGNMEGKQSDKNAMGRDVSEEQLQLYKKMINQYELMVDTKPVVLVVVEKASTSSSPDRPHRLQTLLITLVLSLVFAFLVTWLMDRRRLSRS